MLGTIDKAPGFPPDWCRFRDPFHPSPKPIKGPESIRNAA